MVFKTRKIPVFVRLAVMSAVIAAPLAFPNINAQAQIAESDRPYTPSGHAFNPNKDGSKVVIGSRSEVETRADIYEAENFRRQLEAQARREHLRRFSGHDFTRPSGSYDDY